VTDRAYGERASLGVLVPDHALETVWAVAAVLARASVVAFVLVDPNLATWQRVAVCLLVVPGAVHVSVLRSCAPLVVTLLFGASPWLIVGAAVVALSSLVVNQCASPAGLRGLVRRQRAGLTVARERRRLLVSHAFGLGGKADPDNAARWRDWWRRGARAGESMPDDAGDEEPFDVVFVVALVAWGEGGVLCVARSAPVALWRAFRVVRRPSGFQLLADLRRDVVRVGAVNVGSVGGALVALVLAMSRLEHVDSWIVAALTAAVGYIVGRRLRRLSAAALILLLIFFVQLLSIHLLEPVVLGVVAGAADKRLRSLTGRTLGTASGVPVPPPSHLFSRTAWRTRAGIAECNAVARLGRWSIAGHELALLESEADVAGERTLACLARALQVELAIASGDLERARRSVVSTTSRSERTWVDASLHAMQGYFSDAIGDHDGAASAFGMAVQTLPRWRTRFRDEVHVEALRCTAQQLSSAELVTRHTTFRRTRCTRTVDLVMLSQAYVAEALVDRDRTTSIDAARDLLECGSYFNNPDGAAEFAPSTVTLRNVGRSTLAAGRILERTMNSDEAEHAYAAAASLLVRTDPSGRGEALIRLGVLVSRRRSPTDGLRLLEEGLIELEDPRASLAVGELRAQLITSRHDLYSLVFEELIRMADRGEGLSGAHAFVGATFLESLRRDSLARLIRGASLLASAEFRTMVASLNVLHRNASQNGAFTQEEEAELGEVNAALGSVFVASYRREPINAERIRRAAGNRHALIIHELESDDITIRGVVAWVPPAGAGSFHGFSLEGDTHRIARGFAGNDPDVVVEWSVAAFDKLALSLIPRELAELLRAARPEAPIDLIIAPSGGLWSLPYAAFTVDGEPIGPRCRILLTPSLTIDSSQTARSTGSVVAYLDDEVSTDAERATLDRLGPTVDVDIAESFDEFVARLQAAAPRFAVLSAHGDDGVGLRQALVIRGHLVSVAALLGVAFPPVVVVGACFSARLRPKPGEEPLGLTIVALLNGARWVVGGLTLLLDRPVGDVLATVYNELALGTLPEEAVRRAHDAYCRQGAYDSTDPSWHPMSPAAWAAVTCSGLVAAQPTTRQ
jgi:hypothetical protein